MTAQLIRKSKSARKKAAYNTGLQIIIDKKIAEITHSEREDSEWIARVDAAHRSDRGYRGGNLGHN